MTKHLISLLIISAVISIGSPADAFPGRTATSTLQGGNVSPSSLTIVSGTSPGMLTANPAYGGSTGTYTYLWQQSTNGTTYSSASGTNSSQNYTPGTLTATTYFRRRVISGTDTAYTNPSLIRIGTIPSSVDMNYIRTRTLTKPGVTDTASARALTDPNDVKQVTQFFDGLGRPVQTVARQQTPLGKDLVNAQVYDSMGRETTHYLPYVSTATDGLYKVNPISDLASFNSSQYPSEQNYYGQTDFEPSPLNRATVTYAPGISWVGGGRGTTTGYLINGAADSVVIWNIGLSAGGLPAMAGRYTAGQLQKNVSTDEQSHQVITYNDKNGHTLLKKVQLSGTPGTAHIGWLCTYYVYDDLGNLRFVLQPRAVELINTGASWTVTQSIADELCFRYEYDARNRMIVKKVPGAGEIRMVYDARDRLVLSQDSLQRLLHEWLYTRYDTENRPDSAGLIIDPTYYNNPSYHISQAAGSVSYPTVSNYTSELLIRTFYDDYTGIASAGSLPTVLATTYTSNSSYFITTYSSSPTYAVALAQFMTARGAVTGTMTKVLGTSSQYLYAESFYDDRGRVIQNISKNITGGVDTTTSQYNFSGSPVRTLLTHYKAGNTTQYHKELTKLTYDANLRVKNIYSNIDGAGSDQLIDSVQYDELGRPNAKYLGSSLDSLIYSYNIRNWVTGINKSYLAGTASHFFGMELAYDKNSSATNTTTFANTQFTGNIAGMIWKSTGDGIGRKYDFLYDTLNRLTNANFTENDTASTWRATTMDYTVGGLTYDANGNILSMTQRGYKFGVSPSTPIDQLTYTYLSNSNKLSKVVDANNDSASLLGDFHYKTKGTYDYLYDGNGNLSLDNNKSIDSIGYNYLNLPQQIHMKGKGWIQYVYDAAGNKLKKVTLDSLSGLATTTYYIGRLQYQQRSALASPGSATDTLQLMSHAEGRIRWAFHRWTNGSTQYKWEYDFFEKDHLGNVREVLTQAKDTAQYMATMEAAYRSTENALFYNLASTCVWSYYVNAASGPNPFGTTVTNPNDSVCRISGSTPHEGPAIILKVMAGDRYQVGVNGFWKSPQTSSGTTDALSDILAALANGIVSVSGTAKGTSSALSNTSSSPLLPGVSAFRSTYNPSTGTNPKAYLNYMSLDNQFNLDATASGAIAVGASDNLATLASGIITIKKNGYLYIYLSNESKDIQVFFDNLSVNHYSGPLLEETHYYPFGLTMAGISDKALKGNYVENKYKYNKGSELQNKEFSDGSGLETYDTRFRQLDPQLGRWWQIDPKPDYSQSLYSSMNNNPIGLNDPLGDTTRFPVPQKKWPNVYNTLLEAIAKGKSATITYDSDKKAAEQRSRDAKKGHAPAGPGKNLHEFPPKMAKEGGAKAVVNPIPEGENKSEGGALGSLIKGLNLKTGDKIQYVPIANQDDPDNEAVPQANESQKQNSDDESNKTPGKVVSLNPEIPKTAAKVATAAIVGYIIYKAIVAVATWECLGCGVLVTP